MKLLFLRHYAAVSLSLFAMFWGICAGKEAYSHAEPEYFPNISTYQNLAIHRSWIQRDALHNPVVVFSTPEEIVCSFNPIGNVSCQGHYPNYLSNTPQSVGDDICSEYFFHTGVIGSRNVVGKIVTTSRPECITPPAYNVLLKPHHKLSFNKATCAVGDNHIFACTNGKHGFVLQLGKNLFF